MKDENTFTGTNAGLSFDDEFDPLEDFEPEEVNEGEEPHIYSGPPENTDTVTASSVTASVIEDNRPAEERIADLLNKMATRRKTLLETIKFCQAPQKASSVNEFIDELQQSNRSVYSAATLCELLEKAGALEKVDAEGQPLFETEEEPETVVIDGVEYLEPKKPVEVFWAATDAGREAITADKPLERLQSLFEKDQNYLVIYKRILTLCSQEGGIRTPEIDSAVDNDPLVQEPRLYAPHFVDKLEKCDALTWNKVWKTTDIGKKGLDLLADIEDTASVVEEERA